MNKALIAELLKGFDFVFEMYSEKLPHPDILKSLAGKSDNKKVPTKRDEKYIKHVDAVVAYMDKLLEGPIDEVVKLPSEEKAKLEEIIKALSEDEKDFLFITAFYHDIGKAISKPRHGIVGADVILRSGIENREKFFGLGFTRRQIYFLSNIIRFHDLLAGVGTGETSYLAFSEVLYPVSNMQLIDRESSNVFLDYLLLTNLADVAGSLNRVVDIETSLAIMNDFEIIKQAHDSISKKISDECGKKVPGGPIQEIHMKCMLERNLGHIMPELQRIAEANTIERLRRLLRTGFLRAIQSIDNPENTDDQKDLKQYKYWVFEHYKAEHDVPNNVDRWFIKDDKVNDVMPIVASLKAINIQKEFYEQLAFICKFDYELGFVTELLKSMILSEQRKASEVRKTPHNFRRDLAMAVVFFLNTLVDLFGCFTRNNTRIGIGFERMSDMLPPYKDQMLGRLAGEEGIFKQAEAMTAFKYSVNVWII